MGTVIEVALDENRENILMFGISECARDKNARDSADFQFQV